MIGAAARASHAQLRTCTLRTKVEVAILLVSDILRELGTPNDVAEAVVSNHLQVARSDLQAAKRKLTLRGSPPGAPASIPEEDAP